MTPIYKPKGAAKEYGDYAINIYTGCPHRCEYCFSPGVLRKEKEEFHTHVVPREGILDALRSQLDRSDIRGKTIHLCFTCDPYPTGHDTAITREIIKILKFYGNHVQLLTKSAETRDFDILDEDDSFGITLDGAEDTVYVASADDRINALRMAHEKGIKTWVSFEPVINPEEVLRLIRVVAPFADKAKIGKLNHVKSDINWKAFGTEAEKLCKELKLDYYIKDALKKEMEK